MPTCRVISLHPQDEHHASRSRYPGHLRAPRLLICTCGPSLWSSSQGCLLAVGPQGFSTTAPARVLGFPNSRSPHPTPAQAQMGCSPRSLLLVSWDPGPSWPLPPDIRPRHLSPPEALLNPFSLFRKGHKTIPCAVLPRTRSARLRPCTHADGLLGAARATGPS